MNRKKSRPQVLPRNSSLRFDLIFDLSLLTVCALILSQGLLTLLLRYEMPRDLKPSPKVI